MTTEFPVGIDSIRQRTSTQYKKLIAIPNLNANLGSQIQQNYLENINGSTPKSHKLG